MQSDAVQLARERMVRLREEAERQDAEEKAEAERRFNAMKQSQKTQEEQDAEDQAEAERRYYAMKQSQKTQEEQDAEDQAEAERRYYAMKQAEQAASQPQRHSEDTVGGGGGGGSINSARQYYGADDHSPRGSKYHSGGGADRSGYRASASDYDANNGNNIANSTTADQYVKHEMRRHSDAPNTHSHGVISDYSQYPEGNTAHPDPNDNIRPNPYNQHGDYREGPRNNHMNSIMSDGYEDDASLQRSGSRGRMDSGRLSGRRSEATYGDDGGEASVKRLQQQQYRNEIAQAASAVAPEMERHAVFKQEARYHAQGINLPGNHLPYGNSGYSDPHSHSSRKGNSETSYRSRGNTSNNGANSGFQLG